MSKSDSPHRDLLLDEVERRLGHVGYAEYWLRIPVPERATDQQLQQWRKLSTGDKMRIADQFDRQYESIKEQVFEEWERNQRVKNGIRTGSVLIALVLVFLSCLGIYELLPSTTTHSPAFLPMWWFTSLMVMGGLYSLIHYLAERWFDVEGLRTSTLLR